MIKKDFQIGSLFITDSSFGHVGVGEPDFLERFSKSFGFKPEHVVWMDQVHSPNVEILQDIEDKTVILPETDGVMTKKRGVILITKTADCVPVLLWNDRDRMVAALHCGWRGFFSGILERFAHRCQEQQIPLEHFSAFLGP